MNNNLLKVLCDVDLRVLFQHLSEFLISAFELMRVNIYEYNANSGCGQSTIITVICTISYTVQVSNF